MKTHTPGPWALDQVAAGFNIGVTDTNQSLAVWQRIARVGGELDEHSSKDVKFANAQLISTAPDLLAACKKAVIWNLPHHVIEQLKAAITKAEKP